MAFYGQAPIPVSAMAQQAGFRFPARVDSDIGTCRRMFPELAPHVAAYTHNDGRTVNSILLKGTIPITYRGASYNIPVNIWLDPVYPEIPPTVMVSPTPDMQVKPSQNVDGSGKVFLPYLHTWDQSRSNLTDLCNVMRETFGLASPVYARTAAPPSAAFPPSSGVDYRPSAGSFSGGMQPAVPRPPQVQMQYPPSRPVQAFQPPRQDPKKEEEDAEMVRALLTSVRSHVSDTLIAKMKAYAEDKRPGIITLYEQNQVLTAGSAELSSLQDRLTREQATVSAAIAQLQEKIAQYRESIRSMRQSETMSVDEQVTTTAPLYKQILDQQAEDQAIDDVIYQLGKALETQRVDINGFIKHLRSLAERQFRCRTIVHKARTQAKLD